MSGKNVRVHVTADGKTQYTVKVSTGIASVMQLDERECRKSYGLTEDAVKFQRSCVKVTGTLDELESFVDHMTRDSAWDFSPQMIAACNKRAKEIRTFIKEQRAGKDLP